MRRSPILRLVTIFSFLFVFMFSAQVHASGAKRPDMGAEVAPDMTATMEGGETTAAPTENTSAYAHLDPENVVPKELLSKAVSYFDANKARLKNQEYIVVIDYRQRSSKERFFLVDMSSGNVETYLVSHGQGSDPGATGMASRFSDTDGSLMTSLGFFITAETYYGSNGFSLKLDGQSSTNRSARSRAIVIHGAEYVQPGSVGRSWGCPALEMRYHEDVIERIKGGALVYSVGNA